MGDTLGFDPLTDGGFVHLREAGIPGRLFRARQLTVPGVVVRFVGLSYQVVDPGRPDRLDPGQVALEAGTYLLEDMETGVRHLQAPHPVESMLARVVVRESGLSRPWSPEEHVAHARRLLSHTDRRHVVEAEAHLGIAAAAGGPAAGEAHRRLADLCLGDGRDAEAARNLRALVRGGMAYEAVRIALGQVMRAPSFYLPVIAAAVEAERASVNRPVFAGQLAHVRAVLGDFDGATEMVAIAAVSPHPLARHHCAEALDLLLAGMESLPLEDPSLTDRLRRTRAAVAAAEDVELFAGLLKDLAALEASHDTDHVGRGMTAARIALDAGNREAGLATLREVARSSARGAEAVGALAVDRMLPVPAAADEVALRKSILELATEAADEEPATRFREEFSDFLVERGILDCEVVGELLCSSDIQAQHRGVRAVAELLGRPGGSHYIDAVERMVSQARGLSFTCRVELASALDLIVARRRQGAIQGSLARADEVMVGERIKQLQGVVSGYRKPEAGGAPATMPAHAR